MNEIYLLSGGNIGDRLKNLNKALERVERTVGPIIKKSFVYETAAWGFTKQAPFLNQVICTSSPLEAQVLLRQILEIELELGRKRTHKMGPRVIDIDMLFYGQQVISTADLTVPHPRMTERRFVLAPLNEIAPDFIHPVLKKTVRELYRLCPDPLQVDIYKGQ